MKLKNGLNQEVFDFQKEYGTLTFVELYNERRAEDENGERTEVVAKRNYTLISEKHQGVLRVGVPGDTPLIDLPRGTEVRLENPVLNFMAQRYPLEVTTFLTADNIVPVGGQQAKTKPAGEQSQQSEKK